MKTIMITFDEKEIDQFLALESLKQLRWNWMKNISVEI